MPSWPEIRRRPARKPVRKCQKIALPLLGSETTVLRSALLVSEMLRDAVWANKPVPPLQLQERASQANSRNSAEIKTPEEGNSNLHLTQCPAFPCNGHTLASGFHSKRATSFHAPSSITERMTVSAP